MIMPLKRTSEKNVNCISEVEVFLTLLVANPIVMPGPCSKKPMVYEIC
jgi:hypothetical protein